MKSGRITITKPNKLFVYKELFETTVVTAVKLILRKLQWNGMHVVLICGKLLPDTTDTLTITIFISVLRISLNSETKSFDSCMNFNHSTIPIVTIKLLNDGVTF